MTERAKLGTEWEMRPIGLCEWLKQALYPVAPFVFMLQ